MVGQGVLRECIRDRDIDTILLISRNMIQQRHEKIKQIYLKDFMNFSSIEADLAGYDACFYCLGVSAFGMTEAAYQRITFDYTLAAAKVLVRLNPQMTFIYVSGVGTDSSEKGSRMWARVKGRTENALIQLPFKGAYMFRPGFIQPLHGIKSKTKLYQIPYTLLSPILPLVRYLIPSKILTTEKVGRAMIRVAKSGFSKRILNPEDIHIQSGTL